MIRRLLHNFRAAFLNNQPGTLSHRNETKLTQADNTRNSIQDSTPTSWLRTIFVTSLGVTVLVLLARELKWLQRWELRAYDQMMLLRPSQPPDKRILLVTVTEEDLQQQKNQLSDETINQLLKKIQSYQPRVIGLHTSLYIRNLQNTNLAVGIRKDNIIAACVFEGIDKTVTEIPPPPNFAEDNIGFNDLVTDRDNVVRRGLLFQTPFPHSKCNTPFSFASRLAVDYLDKQKIYLEFSKKDGFYLGQVFFNRLQKKSGGYIDLDSDGSQILINYRNPRNIADTVTLTQVLTDKVNPNSIKDRLVIIGTSARSIDRGVLTPYSISEERTATVSPVFIHAQIASQLISTVLDGRPIIWYFPEWLEIVWIGGWSLFGGFLAWKVRRPVFLLIISGIAVAGLVGICDALIVQAGWVPVVPPALALVFTSIGVLGYTSYQMQLQTKVIILEVEKQKVAIEELNTLLNETIGVQDAPRKKNAVSSPAFSSLLSNRYKVTRVLAQGGFGCTYLAKDTQRPGLPTCVVKQLMPARRDTRFLQVARRLFDSEAEILELLGQHSQIPELYAFFEQEQEFYLVQQFIPGHPLTEELPPHRDIKDENYVVDMLKELLEVVAFIHQRQVIHRDIKPANIIRCNQDNRLVLIDFGAVKLMQPQSKEQTELATISIGTRGYTPPEQFAGHPRLSSDIYALGMIAIQALTGLLPHELQPNPHTDSLEWREWAQVSDKLAAILDKMVRYHASERYKSAVEALEDFKSIDN
ncbi:CHASE2 domain-containing serine/threonine-protein kinase [Rivularia sp. UHCC 0363]|uniref:CHASE2 domain-containing serine/threonine-protein kinase n=1 Tax=Rivularia sp. UHCC 0363 TaxID=3110244 RepID=UPI002B208D2A|nr:CHASE2 domain-containing serine/threonine-protein kinase [Rivularia sp. UHCC 0363]MEA5594641.1 CHASE2 domain-containing serine/threonine-protein kinase [Rivularia sp. UHCC 0363]